MSYVETNEVIPTAAQERRARQRDHDHACGHIQIARFHLEEARKILDRLGADDRLKDCQSAIAMVEDLKDRMEIS